MDIKNDEADYNCHGEIGGSHDQNGYEEEPMEIEVNECENGINDPFNSFDPIKKAKQSEKICQICSKPEFFKGNEKIALQ